MINRDDYDDYDEDDDEGDFEAHEVAGAPAFEWSEEQAAALDLIERWRRSRDKQIFRLFGYAGTGKTTVTKEIARRAGGNVMFCAYTGKAALVMRGMGCAGARTIHSIIYTPLSELIEEAKALKSLLELRARIQPDGRHELDREAMRRWGTTDPRELEGKLYKLRAAIEKGPSWILRENLDPKPRAFIVDECSMVNEALALDLKGFGIPIIVIGDPFQLPPVRGAGYFTEARPDAMLTEIHRQALDSPVTAMATTVRKDGAWALKPGTYGASSYVSQTIAESLDTLVQADQVLCGTHRTRQAINAAIREACGYWDEVPAPGEKLICGRNNKHNGLLNGSQWRVLECEQINDYFKAKIEPWEGGDDLEVIMHAGPFAGRELLAEDKLDADEFDFGYCITVHKSQGSQWQHVALINDGWSGADRFKDRWLYTGITRAQEKVTIIKPQAQSRSVRPVRHDISLKSLKPRGLSRR